MIVTAQTETDGFINLPPFRSRSSAGRFHHLSAEHYRDAAGERRPGGAARHHDQPDPVVQPAV